MFNFLSILLLSFALPAFAGSSHICTAWTQQSGVSCIFAEESANIYQRQCENPCQLGRNGNGNMGPNCDQEEVCHYNNPETFKGLCSEWTQVNGVTCYDPNTQSWEQQWVRACTVGLKETWCSPQRP